MLDRRSRKVEDAPPSKYGLACRPQPVQPVQGTAIRELPEGAFRDAVKPDAAGILSFMFF